MHVMATADDNVLKSQVQVKCQCMQLFTHMGCGSSQIHSIRHVNSTCNILEFEKKSHGICNILVLEPLVHGILHPF